MYLFGSPWSRWQIAFKVITPVLHVAFTAAQVRGSIILWKMYRVQCRHAAKTILAGDEGPESDGAYLESHDQPSERAPARI